MAKSVGDLTVSLHIDIDVDGQPVTELMQVPATMRDMGGDGIHIHLSLDAAKLAQVIMPHIVKQARLPTGIHG